MKNLIRGLAAIAAVALSAGMVAGIAPAASASNSAPSRLTNLAHLDYLLDTASPAAIDGHTTYRLAEEPALTMPWTYADARDGGTFARVGGGPLDPATGHWGQGSYNADDIARAAVVYLRDWKQTGSAASKQKAYELLRSVAYLQTSSGPDAGNVVLWMQPDGTLNPSPVPVELPDPSDSGASYWLARSLWAFGEGYADFRNSDPAFADFLRQRIGLGVGALNREVLNKYGKYSTADGVKVPAWLIADGADSSAEAVLGLSAYVTASHDAAARSATKKLAKGIALMGSGSTTTWPYGAILPWAQSRSMWHAWSSQMPAALAAASVSLHETKLLAPAVADSAQFDPVLLTSGGPDNAWYPTPVDTTQIAYGADSRVESLLAVADAANKPGLRQLAAIEAAWFFGLNKSGAPVYDPATGVTFDGVQSDGSVNHGSGAESTIHGLLAMEALDAHPAVAQRARAVASVSSRTGLSVVEAETATGGTVVTPDSAWTEESQYSGGAYLSLKRGQTATIPVTASTRSRIEPVVFEPYPSTVTSKWKGYGNLTSHVGAPGITAIAGALLPQKLGSGTPKTLTVTATRGTLKLDAIVLRPVVSRLSLTGSGGATQLLASASTTTQHATAGFAGKRSVVRTYDSTGTRAHTIVLHGRGTITIAAGGFAVVTR
ncbi:hypothetical protein BH11ACT2_BH11ACT2_06950 [soil metagenome]